MPTFYQYLKNEALSKTTIKHYRHDIAQFSIWHEQKYKKPLNAEDLTLRTINTYKRHLSKAGKSTATVNRNSSAIRKYLLWAEMDELAGKLQNLPRKRNPPPFLSEAELNMLFNTLDEKFLSATTDNAVKRAYRDSAIIKLLCSGLRISELCRLNTSDVFIARSYNNDENGEMFFNHLVIKSGKKERTILLDDQATNDIVDWLEFRPKCNTKALFINASSERITVRGIQSMLANLGEEVGFKLNSRILRNTYAKRLAGAGDDELRLSADKLGVTEDYLKARFPKKIRRQLDEARGDPA